MTHENDIDNEFYLLMNNKTLTANQNALQFEQLKRQKHNLYLWKIAVHIS